jgi:hypothetical protein
MPRCSSRPPSAGAPAAAATGTCRDACTGPMRQPTRCRVQPSGQRRALPSVTPGCTCTRKGSSMLRRVTSTSGSSGIGSLCENEIDEFGASNACVSNAARQAAVGGVLAVGARAAPRWRSQPGASAPRRKSRSMRRCSTSCWSARWSCAGQPGNAYEVFLDAARRTRDEQLFRRASTSRCSPLPARRRWPPRRAWREALPQSAGAAAHAVADPDGPEPLQDLAEP